MADAPAAAPLVGGDLHLVGEARAVDAVHAVCTLDAEGTERIYPAEELRFEYRRTNIVDPIVLWAVFRVEQVDPIDQVAARLQKSMRVFVRDERPIPSLAKQLQVRGEGDVTVIVLLENGAREVEVKLPGRFRLSPEIAGALKAVPGVTDVQVA